MDNPLSALPLIWLKNINRAKKRRNEEFDADGEKALAFYDGDHDWVFNKSSSSSTTSSSNSLSGGKTSSENFSAPDFKMTVNRTFEFVSIMGPMVYNQNPTVRISPRQYPEIPPEIWGDPMVAQMMGQQMNQNKMKDQVVCQLLSTYLNYIPNETNMLQHARWAIDEALIKGMGALFTEVYTPTGMQTKMVRSTRVKTCHIVLDPDASCFEDVQWIAIECCHPVRQVEKDYNLTPGSLKKGTQESTMMSSAVDLELQSKYSRNKGETYDTLTYWKIYSKIGLGSTDAWLQGDAGEAFGTMVGPFAFLVVAPGVPYPLNLPPESLDGIDTDPTSPGFAMSLEYIRSKLSWQVPHYLDDAWPVEFLSFYDSPGSLYPMSPLKPAFGEQYAIDWIYSMLISKLRVACRSILAVSADAPPEVLDILNNGADYQVVQLGKSGMLEKYIQQWSFQPFSPDIWTVLQGIEQNFGQRTGLQPMLYGAQGERQVRTAAEGNALNSNLNIRPQHMKDQVEQWLTRNSRRQALATRFHIKGQDIIPLMGQEYAALWDQFIANVTPETMVREYEYRMEAGSMRKPNPDSTTANLEQAANTILPMLFEAMGANPQNAMPLNHLMRGIMKNRAMDWPYDIQPPLPPPPPMMPPGAPGAAPPPGAPQEGPPPGPPQEGQGPPTDQGQGPPQDLPPETLSAMLMQVANGGEVPPELGAVTQAAEQAKIVPKVIAQTIIKQAQDPKQAAPPKGTQSLSEIERAVVMAVKELTSKKKKIKVIREGGVITGLQEE